jgi:lipoprotein NlpD
VQLKTTLLALFAGLLVACAGPPPAPAPQTGPGTTSYRGTPDGYYRVRSGDNLSTVAFRYGLDWRDIARLNNIPAPYIIYPDQELRLTENIPDAGPGSSGTGPAEGSSQVQVTAMPSPGSSTTRSLETPRSSTMAADTSAETLPRPASAPSEVAPASSTDTGASPEVSAPVASANVAGTLETGTAAVVGAQTPSGAAYATPANDPARWLWPTGGRLISRFQANDPARKGIDIGGKVGQPIVASANGQVVYSGNGLLGYGELIIVKHSDRMLSAYAHNSKRLVSEGQQVGAGDQIAEMGTNDRNQAELHFEIRANGSPQDPLKYLPQR